ncbi:MAG: LytR C-terminal domain-containing protein [Candidatus Nanopelagicales bacterium]
MRHPHWTSDHRDALLTRVTAITAGVAAASAVGAIALGAGLQAGTTYAKAQKPAPAPDTATEPQAPVAAPEGTTPTEDPATTTQDSGTTAKATPLSPEQIHLVIYNATSTRGVAAAAAAILRQEGFHVDSVAANPGGALRSSTILFSTKTAGGIRAVTKATGIQQTATADTGSTVVLVLGRDWVAATAGTAWAPPQAAPQQQSGGSSSGGTRHNSNGGGGSTTSGGS